MRILVMWLIFSLVLAVPVVTLAKVFGLSDLELFLVSFIVGLLGGMATDIWYGLRR